MRWQEPDLKKIVNKNAAIVVGQRNLIVAWLRRETTLTDDEIREHVIEPLDRVTFRAGFEVGYGEAVATVESILKQATFYKVGFLMVSAAAVASVLWRFIGS